MCALWGGGKWVARGFGRDGLGKGGREGGGKGAEGKMREKMKMREEEGKKKEN